MSKGSAACLVARKPTSPEAYGRNLGASNGRPNCPASSASPSGLNCSPPAAWTPIPSGWRNGWRRWASPSTARPPWGTTGRTCASCSGPPWTAPTSSCAPAAWAPPSTTSPRRSGRRCWARPCVEDPQAREEMLAWYAGRNRVPSASNFQQVLIPQGAERPVQPRRHRPGGVLGGSQGLSRAAPSSCSRGCPGR